MTTADERDVLARKLLETCPTTSLIWDALPESDREAWRVYADVARAWRFPAAEDRLAVAAAQAVSELLTRSGRAETLATALRRYVRHTEPCNGDPCTCGLTALLRDPL